jgi:phenylpyruvate tautomerase PptA (4-oxalocrotonate tautomerase family)
MADGRPSEYYDAVLDAVRTSIVEEIGAPHERVIQRLHKVEPGCLDVPLGKTGAAVLVEVTMLPGRDAEKKQAFFDAVRRRLAASPGVRPEDVWIAIRDVPAHDLCAGTSLPEIEP